MNPGLTRYGAISSVLISALLHPGVLSATSRQTRSQASGAQRGVLRHSSGLSPTITHCRGRRCRVLRRFRKPTAIRKAELSPDGRYALLWYRPDGRAHRVSLHRVKSGSQLADFKPGFGGRLFWTPQNGLVHSWGCGTQCANLRIYDLRGRVTLSAFSNGIIHSPSRRYVVMFPSHLNRLKPPFIWDLHHRRPRVAYRFPVGDTTFVRWTRKGLLIDLGSAKRATRRRLVKLPNP